MAEPRTEGNVYGLSDGTGSEKDLDTSAEPASSL